MLSFDGHDLETLGLCGEPQLSWLESRPEWVEVPGMDGRLLSGRTWGGGSVAFRMTLLGSAEERRNKLSTLGLWLSVAEPGKLVLPDAPDRYYLAVPSGPVDAERASKAESFLLSFELAEPAAYSQEAKTAEMPAGNSVAIVVGGTYPAPLVISAPELTASAQRYCGFRLDGGKHQQLYGMEASSTHAVVFDSGQRVATLDGAAALPTMASDWLVASPGRHTVSHYAGTGAATVSWQERWL